MNKKLIGLSLCITMLVGSVSQAFGAAIQYLPGVTAEMSQAAYWSEDETVLMSWDEIKAQNALTISASGTNMYDLKNQPETVDGEALNEALRKSAQADADYYLGWTYLGEETLAEEEDFDRMIWNTRNRFASENQKVKYAVAVNRTELRAFPSFTPIWDDPKDHDFDYQYLVTVRVNEPLVITSKSSDGEFYLAKGISCSGWVPAEDVAICESKEQWLAAWDLEPEQMLVVYGDKVFTETSNTGVQTSDLMLSMGTTLELAEVTDPDLLVDNRAIYQNYVVWIPVRDEYGNYSKKMTLISEHEDVSVGYLPLTKESLAEVALNVLGNTYGWGGSLNSDDCSGFVRNVYKCFGLELARNTTWQVAMPAAKVDMNGMCKEERIKFMDSLPVGAILFFSGHEMMYLGSENGQYYVISSVSKIRDPQGGTAVDRIRSTLISTLDTKRANGLTWLEALTSAVVPYWAVDSDQLPDYAWYNGAVKYSLQKGWLKNDVDGFFRPEEAVTRAEVVKALWTMDGKKTTTAAIQFTDVLPEADYAEAVRWAFAEGIAAGTTETTFVPDVSVTREQLASILYRYAKTKGMGFQGMWMFLLDFSDRELISEYAYEPICWMTMKGIMNGVGEKRMNPRGTLTRAQLASVLKNFNDVKNAEAVQQ
ncbi:MAG: SH3 domain-containing protein [Firmicutes bacterium]|nr:SH3 domain-containing protein [Bacillota bacterium]